MIELDTIYNEDCLTGMQRIPDGSVDCIICDLPYGTTACKWDSVIPFEPLWEQYKRVTKPNAAIVLFGSEPFSSYLRLSNLDMYKYDWIWDKVRPVGQLNAKKQPMRQHETISVFYRKQPTYNPQMHPYRQPAKFNKQEKGSVKDSDCYGKQYDFESHIMPDDLSYPRSIITERTVLNNSKDKVAHPTQKPVDLIAYLIRTYSNPGDTILDNTIGSGTTAVAALREKRHFIGFELNRDYYDIALRRIKLEQQQQTTLF